MSKKLTCDLRHTSQQGVPDRHLYSSPTSTTPILEVTCPVHTMASNPPLSCQRTLRQRCRRAMNDTLALLRVCVEHEDDTDGPYHQLEKHLASESVTSVASMMQRTCKSIELLANTLGDDHVRCTTAMVELVCSVLNYEWATDSDKYYTCLAAFRLPAFTNDMVRLGALDGMAAHIDFGASRSKLGTVSASTLCRLCYAWWQDPSARTQCDAERMMYAVVASLRFFPCHHPNTIQACMALQAFTSDTPSNQVLLLDAGGLPVLLRGLLTCMHVEEDARQRTPSNLLAMVRCALRALWNAVVSTEDSILKHKAIGLRAVDVLLEASYWMRTTMRRAATASDLRIVCATLHAVVYNTQPSNILARKGGLSEIVEILLAFPTCADDCVTLLCDCNVPRAKAQAVVRAVCDPTTPLPTHAEGEHFRSQDQCDVVDALMYLVSVARGEAVFPHTGCDVVRRQASEWLRDGASADRPPSPKVLAAAYVLATVQLGASGGIPSTVDLQLQGAMVNVVCSPALPFRIACHIFRAFSHTYVVTNFWEKHLMDVVNMFPELKKQYNRAKARFTTTDYGEATWIVGQAIQAARH